MTRPWRAALGLFFAALLVLFVAPRAARADVARPIGWSLGSATSEIHVGRVNLRYDPRLHDEAIALAREIPRAWSEIEHALAGDLDDALTIHFVAHSGRIAEGTGVPQWAAGVAHPPTGEIAIMWRNALNGSRDMHLCTTRDGGESFTAAQKLGEGTWKLEGCPMDGGSVTMAPDGKWITAWRRDSKLFLNEIGQAERSFAEGKQPVIAYAGKDRLIVWEENAALKLQDASGKTTTLAPVGAGPCAVSGPRFATIAWEAGPAGAAGLFVQRWPTR